MWSFLWQSPSFQSPGNKLECQTNWPKEVRFQAGFRPFAFDEDDNDHYGITVNILRSAEDMKRNVPYSIIGEFEFTGTNVSKKQVKTLFAFKSTVTHEECKFYSVSLMVPKANNEMWPKCDGARITVRTRVLLEEQNFLNQLYTKGDFDLWLCGTDGKVIGVHRCVANTLWNGTPIHLTTKAKPFSLVVADEPSIKYLVERMYGLEPSTLKLLCWKKVFLLTMVLRYDSIQKDVQEQFIKSIKSHPQKMKAIGPICDEFPNVKAFQDLKIEMVQNDIQAFMELMDQKEKN